MRLRGIAGPLALAVLAAAAFTAVPRAAMPQQPAPGVPGSVTVTQGVGYLSVSWTAAANADGYKVQWKSGAQAYDAAARQATVTGTSHTITGGFTEYTVRVIATRTGAPDSAPSAEATGSDNTPDPFSFTVQTGATAGATITSDEVTISGINAGASAGFRFCRLVAPRTNQRTTVGAACTLVKNGADVTGATTTVVNGDRIRVKVVAHSATGGQAQVQVYAGSPSAWFTVHTGGADDTPDPFSFTAQTGATAGATVTSNQITVAGVSSTTSAYLQSCRLVGTDGAVTTTGAACTLVKNGADVTGASTTVANGDTVRVKVVANGAPRGRAEAQVRIGQRRAWFRVTTAGDGATPDPFSFADQTGATEGTTVTSSEVTVAGITAAVTLGYRSCRFVSADGATTTTTGAACTLVKNGADVTGASTTVVNGDTVRVRVVANGASRGRAEVRVAIGAAAAWFRVTSRFRSQVPRPGVPVSAPGVPGSVTATPAVQSLLVSWRASANADGYKVQWKSGAQAYSTSTRQATTTGTSLTITGLTAGTTYTVRVIATRTNAPDSAASSEATGTAQYPAPGVPGSVAATPAVGSLLVSWGAAANADGYKVQWKSGAQAYSTSDRQATTTGTSHTLTGLAAGTTYTVRIIATRTNAPDSAASSEATGTAQYPAPGVPGSVAATPAVGSLLVSWGAAANADGYKVQWKSGAQAYSTSDRQATTTGTSHTLTGLAAGTTYTVRIIATRTNAPDSAASSEATGTAQYPAPGVPGSVAATPAVGSLVVSWGAAANADGYKVQWKSGAQAYSTSDRQATAAGTSHTLTGLTAGTSYTVRVIATRTNAPDSAASSEATGTVQHPGLGPPSRVDVTGLGAFHVTVAWSLVANAGSYKVQWKSGAQAYSTSTRQATTTGTSHTITGLTPGTQYTVRVIATRTNAPDGVASSEVTATTIRHSLDGLTVREGVGSLVVSWIPAANADGYKVQWKSGSQSYDVATRQATTSATSHTITGLTAGTEYTVRVIATRTNTPDGAAAIAAGIPQYPAPGVPGSVTATPALNSLAVSWTAAANADGYKVQWKSGSQSYDIATRQATTSGTSHTITGLAAGTTYTVRVIATRTNALDGAGTEVAGIPQYPALGVPGSVTATPALRSLVVSWGAAANADGYKVQWKSGAQAYSTSTRQATVASGTSHTITGLTAGTTYTVRVIVTRTNAPDGAGTEVAGIPQHPAPGVPGNVTVTRGLRLGFPELVVSWAAAANADGYKVQWKSGSQSYDATTRQATTNSTSYTTTDYGILWGRPFTLRVIATRTNAPDSAPSSEVTGRHAGRPDLLGEVTMTPGVGSILVSWGAAANADGYKVRWSRGVISVFPILGRATTTGTSYTITGLTANTEYLIRLVPSRIGGGDGHSIGNYVTTQYPAPGVPGGVTATPALNSLAVSWTAAANADGYKVQWKSGAQAYDAAARQQTVTSGTSHTITGLAAGTEYTVRVIATRANAPDSAASSEATGTPPAAAGVPGSVTAAPAVGSLVVSWAAAANADGYKVQWKSGAQAYNTSDRQATATGTSHTLTGLAAGTTYTVRVIATRTNAPDSAPSSEVTRTAQHPALGVPGSVTAAPALNSLVVSWAAAANADGYKVQWKSGSQSYDTSTRQATITGTSHTITGLTAGTQYTVRVIATRTNRPDVASSEAIGIPQHPAAAVPGSVTATPALNGLAVSWGAAANADGYKVQWKSGSQSYDTSTRQTTATGTSHTLAGLTTGTEYTVRVIATRTNAPDSAPSSEATGTPPAAPGVPGSVTATPALNGLVVSWAAAANADGYKVQWKSGAQAYDAAARQATATGTSHTITGLTAGTEYTVRVIATRTNAPDSAASSEATGTAQYPAAAVPGSVTAAPALNSLVVSWAAAANADGYKVQWKSGAQAYDAAARQATATGTSHTITGLTAGTEYTVRVIATRTNAPDSAASSEATGTAQYPAADVPGSVTATPALNSLAVSWTAAANADGYKVQWKSGGQSYDAAARQADVTSGTSHTITGLTAGTEYTVRVIATRTNAPDSAASSEATGTAQYPVPDVPGSVTAAPALNSLAVSWTAAANADGYKVQWKSGAQAYDAAARQATASGTSHTIPGLTAGTEYTVRVIATRTNAPDSAASSEATGTPPAAAGVPGSVTAAPALNSLAVSWAAAANADGYKVQWKSGAQAYDAAARQATVASGTSHTITGLAAGTTYTVRVIATRTNAPDSAASSEATGTAQYPAPDVPGSVTAAPALNSLAVSWGAAANASGYKVQWKSGAQSYDAAARQATATGTSHTITGLTAGTAYTVRVIATRTNAPDSAASSEATETAQYPAPGVPGSVTAAPALNSLAVSWGAAANADGYKVQWKSGSQSYDTSTRQTTATGTSHTITGLAAGTTYTVRVIATRTNAPDSAASSEATGTAQYPAPAVPGSVAAAPALRSLAVSWGAAANADGYKVQWKSGAQAYDAAARQATATGTSHTITGLAAGTEYTVRVIATRTNAPDSAASSEATGTPPAAAAVPGSVTATPALRSLVVSWAAAANADGYKVQWKSGAQAYDAAARQATATGTSHTITGLAAGTEYTVRVIATRTNAPDSAASSEATGTPPAAAAVPGSVTATPALRSLVVSWAAAANADGYKVQWRSGAQAYDAATRQATATGTSHTLPGLTAGTEYTVRVIATRTNAPDSAASSEATGTPPAAAGVPGSVTAAPALNSLVVSWGAAANADGYKVQWKSGGQSYDAAARQATATGTSHTLPGLTPGTEYTVRVIATRTNAPDSAASSEATGTAQYPAPAVPGSVTATPAVQSLAVSWAAAANAAGYKVQWKSGSQAYNTSDRQATATRTRRLTERHTISGLTPGTTYTVRVIATRTNAPDSAASSEATGTPPTAPGVPGSVTVTPSSNTLAVSWTAATNADGYRVQWKSGTQAYNIGDREAAATGTSHTITGLTGFTEYTVRVIATRANAPDGAPSSEATGTTELLPPARVTATPSLNSLVVSWRAADNAEGYKVQWKSGSQAYNTSDRQATTTRTSRFTERHTITGLAAGTTYTVRVIATRTGASDSAPSAEATGSDHTPDPFSFTEETGATAGATVTSDEVTISGINAGASAGFRSCQLRRTSSSAYTSQHAVCTLVKNGADVTGATTTVVNGDRIRVRVVAHSMYGGRARVQVYAGATNAWFGATTGGADYTPDPFSFTAQTGATAGATVTSNQITVAGISRRTSLSSRQFCRFVGTDGAVTTTGAACTLVKNGADVTSGTVPGTSASVVNGDTVRVKVVANGAPGGRAEVRVTIGTRAAWFRVTTDGDTTPDPFGFIPETGATEGATVTSSEVTVAGITAATTLGYRSCRFVGADGAVTATGAACTLVKNGADVTGASTTVDDGDTVRVKVVANGAPLGRAEVQVTIGTRAAWFRATTRGVAPFRFPDRTGQRAGATVTSDEVTVAGAAGAVTLGYQSCRFASADGAPTTTTGTACTLVKNGADVTGASTTVVNGDTVRVKVVANGAPLGRAQVQVTIGAQSAWFSAVTRGERGDGATPDPFFFTPQAASPGAVVTSNTVTVTGLDRAVLAEIHNCRFETHHGVRTTAGATCTLVRNGADVPGTSATVVNGDRIRVKVVANSDHEARALVLLTIGSPYQSSWFSVGTRFRGVVLTRGDGTPFDAGDARLEVPAGGSATYRVALEDSRVFGTAVVGITVSGGGVSVSRDWLAFTSANWNVPQTVTVTAAASGGGDYAVGALLNHDVLRGLAGGPGIGRLRQYVAVAAPGGGGCIRALEQGSKAVYSVGGRTVTVENLGGVSVASKTWPDVPPGAAEFCLPATLGGDLALRIEPVADGLPPSGAGYAVVPGTAVDVSVADMTPVPPEGLEICLPAPDGAGRDPALLHYTGGAWTKAPGSRYVADRRLVCAGGVRDFSPFAVGVLPGEPEGAAEASARWKALNESVLPELGRAMWGSALDAVTGRLVSPEAGEATAEAGLAKVAGALRANERALEDGSASWKEVLGGESFAFALGAGGGGAQDGDGAAVWGAGDWRRLAREEGALDWSGDLFAAHLGVDLAARTDLRAGLAASWFTSGIDYRAGAVEGSHETRMTMLSPYVGWDAGGGARLWGAIGLGRGEIEIAEDEGGEESADSRFLAAGAGGAKRVWSDGALTVDAKGSLETTRYEVKDNGGAIAGLVVTTRRVRLAAEGARAYALAGGATLRPTLEVGGRWDAGDGATGGGVETGGGVAWADPSRGLTLEARARVLAVHRSDLDEWGASGAVRLDPGVAGRGLSFRLAPSWGTNGSGVARLWEDDAVVFPDGRGGGRAPGGARWETELGYGLPAFSGAGTATPYTGFTSAPDGGGEVHVGARLGLRAGLDLDLRARRDRAHGDARGNVVELRVNARW